MVRSDGNGAFLLAAGCSDDLDNGKNNTGAEEDGEKVLYDGERLYGFARNANESRSYSF